MSLDVFPQITISLLGAISLVAFGVLGLFCVGIGIYKVYLVEMRGLRDFREALENPHARPSERTEAAG